MTGGKVILAISRVSVEVEIGLSFQSHTDWLIISPATVKPQTTTATQKSLEKFRVVAM